MREYALSGVWGREVHLVDATTKYARAPEDGNEPLSMWSNRWSSMPIAAASTEYRLPGAGRPRVAGPNAGSGVPVIRQPFRQGDLLPYWAYGRFSGNHLYNLRNDPTEDENRAGTGEEREAADRLRQALMAIEAPDDQLARLGLG